MKALYIARSAKTAPQKIVAITFSSNTKTWEFTPLSATTKIATGITLIPR